MIDAAFIFSAAPLGIWVSKFHARDEREILFAYPVNQMGVGVSLFELVHYRRRGRFIWVKNSG